VKSRESHVTLHGAAVALFVSVIAGIGVLYFQFWHEETRVPPLRGMSQLQAERALFRLGLIPSIRYVEGAPNGTVADQEPPAGARTEAGNAILIVVGLGPVKNSVLAATAPVYQPASAPASAPNQRRRLSETRAPDAPMRTQHKAVPSEGGERSPRPQATMSSQVSDTFSPHGSTMICRTVQSSVTENGREIPLPPRSYCRSSDGIWRPIGA
jgi:beta-lactam-binding protein with PASTA domain